MLTIVEYLAAQLQFRWLPKWHGAFIDPETGGFYERLGPDFKPRLMGARRLLSQCRQLSIYCHAAHEHPGIVPRKILSRAFDFIVSAYHMPDTGGWRYSLDDEGRPLDETSDLYTLAFVIFGCSHYFSVTQDPRARDIAIKTLSFINLYFRIKGLPGLVEALDRNLDVVPRMRRQNPHMHLLEACLFAYDTWGNSDFRAMADEMVTLFYVHFYLRDQNALVEFFASDLTPDPETGHRVEPGHYFEWVWLLKKHAQVHNDPSRHDMACRALLEWANRYGWDEEKGGIYDVLDPSGRILVDTKRIWPFTESLKANVLMLSTMQDKKAFLKARAVRMIHVFRARYMQERGFWVEWLHCDLSPATDYMPATTPYHVYFGIMETRDILRKRGKSASLRGGMIVWAYTVRRMVSLALKALRMSVRRV